MNDYVLDASALLALLNEEPGSERVERSLAVCTINAVNYCETIGKLIDAGVPEDDARTSIDLLGIEIIPFDSSLAMLAASLRPATKKYGLSLGDRCCLALALQLKATALTAERVWSKLNIGASIEVIR